MSTLETFLEGRGDYSSLSQKDKLDVSVVIVSWNTRDILRDCLRSVFEQTRQVSFDVFVVDNDSHDGSAQMVRAEFPNVKLIENKENRGFAAANNQAIQVASARYVLLLNPDTIVLEDAISRCVAYADLHPDVGVVGCQVLEDDYHISPTSFSFPTPWTVFLELSGLSRAFPRSRLFGRPELGWWDRKSEQDVDVIAGMFMLVRREAIAQVGILDELIFRLFRGNGLVLPFFASWVAACFHTLRTNRPSRWWPQKHLTGQYQDVRSNAEEFDDLSEEESRLRRFHGDEDDLHCFELCSYGRLVRFVRDHERSSNST